MGSLLLALTACCATLPVAQDDGSTLAPAPAAAGSWSRFRGLDGAGSCSTPWRALEPGRDLLFRQELLGTGHSSPVVANGRVWLTECVHEERLRRVVALDQETGEELWSHESGFELDPSQHRFNSYASSTPAVSGDHVVVAWTGGGRLEVMAFQPELQDDPLWVRDLGGLTAQHGSGSSPVIEGGAVIITQDCEDAPSCLRALSLHAGGEELWRLDRDTERASYMTPIVRQVSGGRELILSSTAHGVFGVDPSTGRLNWELDGIFRQRCVGSPAMTGGLLYASAGSGSGGKEAVILRLPTEGVEPEVLHRPRRVLPYVPCPLGHEGSFFLWTDSGQVARVDADTGEQVWSGRTDATFFASPILIGDTLVNVGMEGELLAVGTGEEFEVLQRLELGEASYATPAVVGEVLFIRTTSHLHAFSIAPE